MWLQLLEYKPPRSKRRHSFKLCHHLLLLVLNTIQNTTFSSIVEVKTPVIILWTIYIIPWKVTRLSSLKMIIKLRWESPFRRNSWLQLRHWGSGGWRSSTTMSSFNHFCNDYYHLQKLNLDIYLLCYWNLAITLIVISIYKLYIIISLTFIFL